MRGPRINTDRFPERAPKAQGSRGGGGMGGGGSGVCSPRKFPGFVNHSDSILASSILLR